MNHSKTTMGRTSPSITRCYCSRHLYAADDKAPNLTLYGGLYDTLVFPCNLLFRGHEFEARHFLNALVGLLGIVGCWKVARFVAGPAVAFWAALLLSIMPRYYGAMFNNPKDIPFAVGYIWSITLFSDAWNTFHPCPQTSPLSWASRLTTLATRIGDGAFWLFRARNRNMACRSDREGRFLESGAALGAERVRVSRAGRMRRMALDVAVLALAQVRPLTRPFEAMRKFSHYDDWRGVLVFNGVMLHGPRPHVPRTYVLQWLFMTLPRSC